MRRAGVAIGAVLLLGATAIARADQTSIGITVNATSGAHVMSGRSETVPFVPLPMIEIERAVKRWRLHLEGVPPIGPVPLGASDAPFGGEQSRPRLSFLSADALYALPGNRISLGIGEALINQRTTYPPSTLVQASRVVGARYSIRAMLRSDIDGDAEVRASFAPSMHGVQYTSRPPSFPGDPTAGTFDDPEHGSLVDASLRETHAYGRLSFVYGVRYLNYSAAYDATNRLADRNHLLMPFVGWQWNAQGARVRALRRFSATREPMARERSTTVGLTAYAVSGYESSAYAYSAAPKDSAVLGALSVSHQVGTFEVRGEVMPRRANANIFGQRQMAWDELTADVLYHPKKSRVAFGIGDGIIRQTPEVMALGVHGLDRAEGVRYVAHALVSQDARGGLSADLAIAPYVHDVWRATGTYIPCPACNPQTFDYRSIRHGSRADASLAWTVPRATYAFTYGLRYMLQTLNFGYGSTYITHDATLMPFVGITTGVGKAQTP